MAVPSIFAKVFQKSQTCLTLSSIVLQSRNISSVLSCSRATKDQKPVINTRLLHQSMRRCGLEEFFDDPKNFGKRKVKTGMAWSKDLLRKKSIEDLQKIWFVLLKERNMLNTLENYCINHDEPMPSPERLEKVAESMSNLRDVIDEREHAVNMLTHGTTDKVGGEWRKSQLGYTYFFKFKEYLMPKELNKEYRGDRPADIAMFHPKLEEWHLRMEEKRQKKRGGYFTLIGEKYSHMRGRNPHLPKKMPQWFKRKFQTKWLYGIHPQMPVFKKFVDKDPRIQTTPYKRY